MHEEVIPPVKLSQCLCHVRQHIISATTHGQTQTQRGFNMQERSTKEVNEPRRRDIKTLKQNEEKLSCIPTLVPMLMESIHAPTQGYNNIRYPCSYLVVCGSCRSGAFSAGAAE
jgi:hypothetical protein